jgi:hypothetical protein
MENEIIEARYDASLLETKFDTTPEGFLTGNAIVTRIGVFPYKMQDGTIRYELRHPDDVFHADSLATLTMKPITNDHPKAGLVTSENAKMYVVGSTGSTPLRDNKHLAIPIVVHDGKAIKDVKKGKRQLSVGYKCTVVPEVGEFDGMAYTHRQTKILVNHVAIVQAGRAGAVAQIRMDGALAPIDIEDFKENDVMDELKTINLDSVDYQADMKVIEAYQANKLKAEETQVKLDEAIADKTKLEAERDAVQEKFDAMEKELTSLKANHVDADKVAEMVKQRVALEAFAQKAEVEVKADMSDVDIKKAVVLKEFPSVKAEKLEDSAYLDARFDSIVEDWETILKQKENAKGRLINEVKADGNDAPKNVVADAKKKYLEQLANAHKVVAKGEK